MSEQRADAAPAGDLLAEADRLIAALETHPDPDVAAQLRDLLEAIDAVHRTALTHLVEGIRGMAGEAFLNRLTADPAIRLLLMSYDLIAVDRRIHAEEALDAVRGHLHGHGIDVELEEVVGGAVYVRLHGLDAAGVPVAAVRRDIEAALEAGLIGFQQLELDGRATAAGGLVRLDGLRRPNRPVHRRVAALADVPAGGLLPVGQDDGTPILLVRLDDGIHAVRNRCGTSPLPLEFGTLEGDALRCSWHGCLYDVRSGRRLDDPGGDPLAVYPVSVVDGEIRVALGVEPVPDGDAR